MKKRVPVRKLNKYEKAYLKKIQKYHLKKKKKNYKKEIKIFLFLLQKKVFIYLQNIMKSLSKKTKKIKRELSKKKKTTFHKKHIKKNIKRKRKIHHDGIKKPKKHKKKRSFWKKFRVIVGVLLILFLLSLGALFVFFSSLEIPSVDNFDKRKISNSTKIYDKTGEILLYDIHENIQRTVVTSDKISPYIKNAIVAIEDHNFYQHHGVVWKSTFRAIIQTILSKIGLSRAGSSGGSTLTQQMVKNTLLTREKTITRKMKEWILAYKIEKKLTKDEILTTYLNEAPYGGTIYGVQEAARVFFGKTAADINLAEAAYLAAIPNLPTFYSPYGQHKKELDKRHNLVLIDMKKYGFISNEEYQKALNEKVHFLPKSENNAKALHFVQYVRSILEKKYGVDMVENGGLKVITTLDYKLQQQAEKIIKEHIKKIEKDMHASNAALVAIESQTGNIITMVGSRDYFDTNNFDGNFNVAISPRQPGSSFKPIAYATAFEKGYLPESAIFDTPTQFNSHCEPTEESNKNHCYFPRNWDGKFKGPMSFRNALAQSRNIPAIKVLYLAGVSRVIDKAHELGISSLNKKPSYYGLNLVLGGGEVSLLEMTSAYTTFSNKGKHNKVNAILKITDVDGNILEEYQQKETRVFSKNVSNMISSILSDNIARTPLYGAHSGIYFGNISVAGKTGTTNDKRDAWMLGYTSDVAVGVWTGNNDNSPMKKGSKLSIQPWHDFMQLIIDDDNYKHRKFEDYTIPDNFLELPSMIRGDWKGGETYIIDSVSGKLATEYTPEETKVRITKFDPHTILYSVNKDDPQTPGNSQNDPQFKNWEYGVQKYIHEFFEPLLNQDIVIPTEYDDVHGPNGIIQSEKFDFSIDGILSEYHDNDEVIVHINFDGIKKNDVKEAFLYVNNNFIDSINTPPFGLHFNIQDIQKQEDENIIRVVVENKDDEKVIHEKKFKIINE